MKQLLSLILAVVLVGGVGSSAVNGTMAEFFDTEVSADNEMCAGTLLLRVIGGPIEAGPLQPCDWYEAEMEVVNCGTRDGIAYLKLENIEGIEDALYEAVTAEPEYVAEYGGQLGQVELPGLGEDTCDLYNHVDIEIWCDKDDDEALDIIYEGKLGEVIPCEKWKLGKLYAATQIDGGWGTYFEYDKGQGTETAPVIAAFIANQTKKVGWVSVWDDCANLHVKYDTRQSGWGMDETHLYVGAVPPPSANPGGFPYKHHDLGGTTTDDYTVALGGLTHVYIAAHAAGGPYCKDTAWAMRGPPRKLLVKLHVQDFDEEDAFAQGLIPTTYFDENDPDVQEKCWDHWPTNVYMGDICQFDMKFTLNQDYCYRHWNWRSGRGWTYNWFYR